MREPKTTRGIKNKYTWADFHRGVRKCIVCGNFFKPTFKYNFGMCEHCYKTRFREGAKLYDRLMKKISPARWRRSRERRILLKKLNKSIRLKTALIIWYRKKTGQPNYRKLAKLVPKYEVINGDIHFLSGKHSDSYASDVIKYDEDYIFRLIRYSKDKRLSRLLDKLVVESF